MQRYFTGIRNLYWILNVAGAAAITALTIILSGAIPWLKDAVLCVVFGLLLFLVWIVLTTKMAANMARKNMRNVINILENDCDPEKYIGILQGMAKIPNKEVFKNYLSLKICNGYIHMSKYNEAERMISGMANAPAETMGGNNRYEYMRSRLAITIYQGEYEKAEEMIQALKDLHDAVRDEKTKRNITYQIKYYSAVMRMDQGNYDQAEEAMKELLDMATCTLQKVTAQSKLGELYAHFGKTEEAKEAFQYVIEHGNKLDAAVKAKEHLEKMAG